MWLFRVIEEHAPTFPRDIWRQPLKFQLPSYTSLPRYLSTPNHNITVFAAGMSVTQVDIDPEGDTLIILPHGQSLYLGLAMISSWPSASQQLEA
jgi:hypothetical protein